MEYQKLTFDTMEDAEKALMEIEADREADKLLSRHSKNPLYQYALATSLAKKTILKDASSTNNATPNNKTEDKSDSIL